MRRIAWVLLLLFAFAIPWEYSLDLGEPLGNVARIVGLLMLIVAIPAVLQSGRVRTPGAMQWLVLAFCLWLCCTYFWTIDADATLTKLRGYFQEVMIVWLVWEFAESPTHLRDLLRAYIAGSWVLAALTIENFSSLQAAAAEPMRFVAYGQDPNDVARFLDLGFPLATLLLRSESRWPPRLLALGYLPLGLFAVLLTASRGGFLAALAALGGCGVLLLRGRAKAVLPALLIVPVVAIALWFVVPHAVFDRLATIPEQLQGGDLNQRLSIWAVGWRAFAKAPLLGTGAGTFVSAAGLAPIDTAHNTVLSILVSGGLCALFLAAAIVMMAMRSVWALRGALRIALGTALLVWMVSSLAATVVENRTTWLLLALIALAARFSGDDPDELDACFPADALPRDTVQDPRGGAVLAVEG
jgi:O-antigen ligase